MKNPALKLPRELVSGFLGMLFSKGGCTQGFNTFLTALKRGLLNPFGTNEEPRPEAPPP
jgi:hypothetical protein